MQQKIAYSILGIAILFSGTIIAQPHQKLNIEQATIFLSGAELTSTATVNLPKGESEVIFTNVSGTVNQQSLYIRTTNDVVIESSTFQNNYLNTDNQSPKVKAIKDSIDKLNEEVILENSKTSVINEELAILQENKKVGGQNTGLSVAELQKMLDLVNNKMLAYLNDRHKIEVVVKKLNERISNLNNQLSEEQRRDYQPGGQLLVKFHAEHATSTDILMTYVVTNAGWNPVYDLRVNKLNDPVKLYYKANVYQNTGVKWENVKLSLSTGNPTEGAQAPTLSPWALVYYVPPPAPVMYKAKMSHKNEESYNAYRGNTFAGARSNEDAYIVDPATSNSLNNYVTVNNSGVNASFDIDLPYTIPSDGQEHLVSVKSNELPASYRYYAVPKLDKDAFLQAQVTGWQDLNLLPGKTNIFYEGSYVGQGYIDALAVTDTMTFSLGRDKKIVVKRERDKQMRTVRTIGTNVNESFAYNITIHNTRNDAIKLVIADQFPISTDNDIQVEDKNADGADINPTTGEVNWTLSLKANETKKQILSYNVKYPKGKTIANLK